MPQAPGAPVFSFPGRALHSGAMKHPVVVRALLTHPRAFRRFCVQTMVNLLDILVKGLNLAVHMRADLFGSSM